MIQVEVHSDDWAAEAKFDAPTRLAKWTWPFARMSARAGSFAQTRKPY
jgi:hypothetical protein